MASIEKRNGSYRITVSNGFDCNGKRIKEITTFTPAPGLTPKQEEKALQKFVMEFEDKVKNGTLYSGDKITLSQFAQKWLTEYAKLNLREKTYQEYVRLLNSQILPLMGHLKIGKITPLHIEEFKSRLLSDGIREDGKSGGYSSATATRYYAVLSKMLSCAASWNLISYNPCRNAHVR